jgi:hypothetical protein
LIFVKQKLRFKAPLEHVFSCCTDISYIQEELIREAKGKNLRVKIRYKEIPFEVGTELIISSKKPLLKVVVLQNIQNTLIKSSIVPYANLMSIFGEIVAEARFTTHNSDTVVDFLVESAKHPSLLLRIVIKIVIFIMLIASRKDGQRFIDHVESTA